jgi:hypothetical protein
MGSGAYTKEFSAPNYPPANICGEYLYLVAKSVTLTNSMKYILTGFNMAIRMIVIGIVTWIGYPTETMQL